MIQVTEGVLLRKYGGLPPKIKETIDSSKVSSLVGDICSAHSLSEEDKELFAVYTAYILLGLLEPKNFLGEIRVFLGIPERTIVEIIREINFQIFSPLHKELEELYKLEIHIEEELKKEFETEELNTKEVAEPVIKIKPDAEPVLPRIEIKRTPITEESPIPVFRPEVKKEREPLDAARGKPAATAEARPFDKAQDRPFVIHKEEEQRPATEGKKFKGFDFPFGMFDKGKGSRTTPSEPVKVKVETPGQEKPLDKTPLDETRGKQGKRVVHYSEYRTPLTPFERPEEDIIDLQTFTKHEAPPSDQRLTTNDLRQTSTVTQQTADKPQPAPEVKKKEEPKTTPSIEGNIVDLRQTTND